jgi:hypothetical protein
VPREAGEVLPLPSSVSPADSTPSQVSHLPSLATGPGSGAGRFPERAAWHKQNLAGGQWKIGHYSLGGCPSVAEVALAIPRLSPENRWVPPTLAPAGPERTGLTQAVRAGQAGRDRTTSVSIERGSITDRYDSGLTRAKALQGGSADSQGAV